MCRCLYVIVNGNDSNDDVSSNQVDMSSLTRIEKQFNTWLNIKALGDTLAIESHTSRIYGSDKYLCVCSCYLSMSPVAIESTDFKVCLGFFKLYTM